MSLRSAKVQAILYGFPIPITIALLGGDRLDVAAQYVGVVVLVLFFFVVATLADRVDRVAAVAGGLLVYIGVAIAISRWLPLDALAAFVVAGAGWLVHLLVMRRRRQQRTSTPARDLDPDLAVVMSRPGPLVWLSVPFTTALTWLLGGLLGSLVVTFPYSGVPVALSTRGDRWAFAHHFAGRAGLVLGFLGIFHLAARDLPTTAALLLAWAAFLTATVVTNRTALLRVLRPARPRSAPTAGK